MNNDPIFIGQEKEVKLPDSRTVTIREVNGEDEGIISRVSTMADGTNIRAFLAGIITKNPDKPGEATVANDLLTWPTNSIYYLLLEQRIFNHGNELSWKFKCPAKSCREKEEVTLIEDLSEFLLGSKSPFAIKPYPNGTQAVMEFTVSSKKTFRYKILNGELEKTQLALSQDALDKNTKFTIRELELHNQGSWLRLNWFGGLSAKDTREIRQHIEINDWQFNPIVRFNCPECNAPYQEVLINMPSFYWPEEG